MDAPCSAPATATVTARKTSGGHTETATFELHACCGALIQHITSRDGVPWRGGGLFCVTSPRPTRETAITLITAEGWEVTP